MIGLFSRVEEYDFSTGAKLNFKQTYDCSDIEQMDALELDSDDAAYLVHHLKLNFDTHARYHSAVIDGDKIINQCTVEWAFWKTVEDKP